MCFILTDPYNSYHNDTFKYDYYKEDILFEKMRTSPLSSNVSGSNNSYIYDSNGMQGSGAYCLDIGFSPEYFNGNFSNIIKD